MKQNKQRGAGAKSLGEMAKWPTSTTH